MTKGIDLLSSSIAVVIAIIIGFMVIDKVNLEMDQMYNFCQNKDGMYAYGGSDDMAFDRNMINCTSIRLNQTTMLASSVTLVTDWRPLVLVLLGCCVVMFITIYFGKDVKNETKNCR